jgi:two-component system chemotaxis response regulator CheY
VLEAADGNEGLAKAQATMPDLIIIEMASPEPDGCEICKRLKAMPALQHIPILFTGASQNYSGAYDLGAQGFLIKPFGPTELIKVRNELLKGKTYWPPLPRDPWLLFDQSK